MKYNVNEIFKSLQGEGFNQGKEVVFIRLAGCNLDCEWCDTDFSKKEEYTADELLVYIKKYNTKSVIITGGEPSIHDLKPLFELLKKEDYWIGMESNGTNNLDSIRELTDYITVSPKGKTVQYDIDELRVVNRDLDIDTLLEYEQNFKALHYYLSPLDKDGIMNIEDTLKLLGKINEIGEKDWRLSIQTHKLAGIR